MKPLITFSLKNVRKIVKEKIVFVDDKTLSEESCFIYCIRTKL